MVMPTVCQCFCGNVCYTGAVGVQLECRLFLYEEGPGCQRMIQIRDYNSVGMY